MVFMKFSKIKPISSGICQKQEQDHQQGLEEQPFTFKSHGLELCFCTIRPAILMLIADGVDADGDNADCFDGNADCVDGNADLL